MLADVCTAISDSVMIKNMMVATEIALTAITVQEFFNFWSCSRHFKFRLSGMVENVEVVLAISFVVVIQEDITSIFADF